MRSVRDPWGRVARFRYAPRTGLPAPRNAAMRGRHERDALGACRLRTGRTDPDDHGLLASRARGLSQREPERRHAGRVHFSRGSSGYACPEDNLALNLRPWGGDLIHQHRPRTDEAYLALLMLSITGLLMGAGLGKSVALI